MVRVAINGFGRIGRIFFRVGFLREEMEIVAINDLGDIENLAYLLRHDSVYREWGHDVSVHEGKLIVDGKSIAFIQEKDPTKLPWKDLGVDVVVESTGFFETFEKARAHVEAGAKRVVISAPAKDNECDDAKTILMGMNEDDLNNVVVSSNGSCTTNSVHPAMQILNETIGVKKAMLTTVHAYTATQKLVDGPDKNDWRRGRAAAQNISPSTTGAAIAVTRVVKDLQGKFDGIAVRVPVISGSLSTVVFLAGRPTTMEEVNSVLMNAEQSAQWKGVFKTTIDPLVSSDIIGISYASLIDLSLTKVIDGDLVSIGAWYDNEMGYTHMLVEHVIKSGLCAQK
ncbi:MAG: type I glyceraldehyde-3-phosphate dehydrogenase [Candidatus Azambacteria bacterium]|nr:type I glyceraldehyde-3-phosphate dehydrogenase [Candidatus Azambacteria bacterium]